MIQLFFFTLHSDTPRTSVFWRVGSRSCPLPSMPRTGTLRCNTTGNDNWNNIARISRQPALSSCSKHNNFVHEFTNPKSYLFRRHIPCHKISSPRGKLLALLKPRNFRMAVQMPAQLHKSLTVKEASRAILLLIRRNVQVVASKVRRRFWYVTSSKMTKSQCHGSLLIYAIRVKGIATEARK